MVPDSGSFVSRILTSADSEAFRALRMETLLSYGDVFAQYYQNMKERPEDFWRQFCVETEDGCLFGLFDADMLVGVVGTEKWEKDEMGQTALWTYAYLKPEYRGRKLAAGMYEARERWTKNKPRYKRAVLSILDGRTRSIEIQVKHGARFLYTEQMRWYDGAAAPWHWYEKIL